MNRALPMAKRLISDGSVYGRSLLSIFIIINIIICKLIF